MERKFHIIENPSELGAGVRGPALGPISVRLEDNRAGNKIYGRINHSTIPSLNHRLCEENNHPNANFINSIVEQNTNCISEVQKILKKDLFPIILSGDHSNALGTIAALKDYSPEKKLGVIWIDAHADLHTPYTSPTGNIHGMPLGASLGESYASNAINKPNESTISYWKDLTHLGQNQIHPKIEPSDLLFIDIRDLEEQEWKDIDDNNIKYYVPARLLNKSMSNVAADTLKYLDHCDHIYISFDVDSMDPSVSRGTGTSVENGLSLDQAKELLSTLMQSNKICALEITEINPLIDEHNKMAKAALSIMKHLL